MSVHRKLETHQCDLAIMNALAAGKQQVTFKDATFARRVLARARKRGLGEERFKVFVGEEELKIIKKKRRNA
jgi:hypothetical protein